MEYDPIKSSLGKCFNRTPGLRKLFYRLLDLLLLRTWHVHKALRRLIKSLPQDAHLLDAGSGFGQYTYYLARKMPQASIKAVDVKQEQMEDCTRFFGRIGLNRVQFETANLLTFVEEEKYNLILSVDVMEHILEDTLVLSNFCRSLVPGGTLLLSTPSDKGGSEAHDDHDESFIGEHVRCGYSVQEMYDKLALAGFTSAQIRYTYAPVGQMAWRLSMKYPIELLSCSKWFFILLPFYYILVFPFCLIMNYLDLSLKHKTGTGLMVTAQRPAR